MTDKPPVPKPHSPHDPAKITKEPVLGNGAVPLEKPSGPMIYEVRVGANILPSWLTNWRAGTRQKFW